MIDSEGSKSGYGYEVIRMMSKYLDVDFEYIGYENGWEDMADYAKEKGFSYTPVYFELHNDMEKALQKGDVDALLTSSLRKTEEERILDSFAIRDFYVMLRKDDTELLDEINYAINQLNAAEGDWQSELEIWNGSFCGNGF